MKKTFEDLMVSVKADDRKTQRENLGVHLCTTPSDLYLFEQSNKMLTLVKVWAENWETIHAEVAPKVEAIRNKMVENKAAELAKYSDAEWEQLVALRNAKRGEAANTAEADAEKEA